MFTNLTQAHLDFHDTMEDYFQAKRRLFVEPGPGVSVINVGDPYGRRLAAEIDGARTFAASSAISLRASCRCRRWDGHRWPDTASAATSPRKHLSPEEARWCLS